MEFFSEILIQVMQSQRRNSAILNWKLRIGDVIETYNFKHHRASSSYIIINSRCRQSTTGSEDANRFEMSFRPFQDELQFNGSRIQNEWSSMNFTSSNADFNGTAATKPIPDRNSSVEFLFECFVIAIASVGTLANGFVIAILLSQLRKKTKLTTSNKFTINQLVLDLYSCMAAILVYGWRMMNHENRPEDGITSRVF